tara:strand:+ start:1996 stop:2361 length:366 start_codon:yes stop_codon:yes gene_type:complete
LKTQNNIMELIHYFSSSQSLYFLKIKDSLKRNFLFVNLKDFPFKGHMIAIEINKMSDYLDNSNLKSFDKKSFKISGELIYNKKNKFIVKINLKNDEFLLKAHIPFWGKVNKNNIWLTFVNK